MNRRTIWFTAAIIATFFATTGYAQVNGIKTNARVFNDFSTTNLTIVNSNSVNGGPGVSQVTLNETNWTDDGIGGNFANRHDFDFSTNNGASNATFGIDSSFTVSTLINLSDGSNAPRKEAGIRINSPTTGDALFLVNSDAGEIVAFGGGAPFFIFGKNSTGDGYTPGTTILLGFTEKGGGDGNGGIPNTIEYFIDRLPGVPGGEATSGPLAWSNLELGPVAYNVALYNQSSPNLTNQAEFVNVNFNDIKFTAIPEPASCLLSVLGLIGLACIRHGRTR
jgi:hypothetical protein